MYWEYFVGRLTRRPSDNRLMIRADEPLTDDELLMHLSFLGSKRWELIALVPFQDEVLAIFKREELEGI